MTQELENAFKEVDDIDKHVEEAVKQDEQEKSKGDTKLKAILGEDECAVQNCRLKQNYEAQKKQLTDLRHNVKDLTAHNEQLRKALEKTATEDQRQDCLVRAMKDKFVQVLKEENEAVKVRLDDKDSSIIDLKRKIRFLEQEKEQYTSLLESDQNLNEQYKQLKLLEERTAKLKAHCDDLVRKHRSFESKAGSEEMRFLKINEQRRDAAEELVHVRKQVGDAKMICRKGFRIEPKNKQTIWVRFLQWSTRS